MTGIYTRFASRIALATVLFTGGAALAAAEGRDSLDGARLQRASGVGIDEELRLNTSITISGKDVHLGDIFTGYLSRPEKVVAQAPRPGQRMVLSAEWLNTLSRTYGLNWKAANGYDRAVVYTPGQTVAPAEIINAVKADLIAKGMPANFSVAPNGQVPTLTIAADSLLDIGVREAFFDARAKTFSAVVEIPPGAPNAQFVTLRGSAYPVVTVPALKTSAPKNTIITAAMLTTLDLPEEQMRPDTITDPADMIGKAPKIFVRGGVPVRENDIAQMTLVDVPVLTMDVRRDTAITKTQVTFATFNSADLPGDVVTDAKQLIGHTPRRLITAGAPLRRGDVQMVRQVQVPVANRDLARGEVLDKQDINWVSMDSGDVAANTITDESELLGRATKHPVRAGQAMRIYDVARPIAVERDKLVTIIWSVPSMNLTVQGKALDAGGVGDVIRVSNTKSKTTVTAEVIDAQTVRITAPQQTASR